MRKRHARGLTVLLTGAMFLTGPVGMIGCSDDDEATESDPVFPAETPTTATMEIDLSDLGTSGIASLSGPCHASSAFLVTVANSLIVVALAIPVAVLGATVQNDPIYVGDQTWRWSASGGTGADAWSSEFDGHLADATTVEWTMRISGTRFDLDSWVWYTGVSNIAASSGSWDFNDPNDRERAMRSTYSVVSEDTATLTFENVDESSPGVGDELVYDAAGDDLSVAFDSASENATLSIEWSKSTGAGMQTNFQGLTCCWGARPDFDDVQCP